MNAMNSANTNSKKYISPEGFKKLQDEFRQLFQVERPRLVEVVAWAASNGDRSENGDYIYGKRRLREIDKRLHFLKDYIEAAHIVHTKDLDQSKVWFGCQVTLVNEDEVASTYHIVGETEIEPELNKISWKSPLAKALLGKSCGDEVQVKTPRGIAFYEITHIEYTISP